MNKDVSIKVCMGTGGIAAGGGEVMAAFNRALSHRGIQASVEKHCSVHQVGCRGFCARDVLVDVIVDGAKATYEYIKPDMVEKIVVEHIVGGTPVAEWRVKDGYDEFHNKQVKVLLADCGELDPENINSYIARKGYEATRKVLTTMTPRETIDVIKASGLRGRGGAGFPTGVKWDSATKVDDPIKYIICNADEGDPGAFMDRAIIEGNPHALIEGMIIGAFAIGSHKGYVYIRAEYPLAVDRLRKAIADAKTIGYLGKNIMGTGFDFDIKINLGAGAFVCGESTALMRSIEGKRGMPRPTPPRSTEKGLYDKPTVLNNVETLANVPYIIRNGAAWFASYGTEKSKGTKVLALTGKIKNPGLIEIPMGIPLRQIVYDIGGGIEGGKRLKAVQSGGPSGGCIPVDLIDTPVDFESLAKVGSIMGSGGMVVLDETDCMVNVAKYFLKFTESESCGKCIPCRIGTKRLLEILTRITEGKGREGDIQLLEDLSYDVMASSLCGLGQSAPNPIMSTIRYYRHEYEAHIYEKRCPAGVCKDLLSYSIVEEFCKGCTACARVCPAGAIIGEKKKPHKIIQEMCIKCGACFETCKFKSIRKG
jgi:NADH:ubiquinone oxidoreductase subunit F (NADH-binding)/NAD-dependent dihydropyrimidine dehydrogenase PreA subunit/(2Fe-2S) ferredoxin